MFKDAACFERSKLLSELLLPFVRRSLGFLLWHLTSKSLLLSETCRSLDIFSIWNILCKPWTWLCGKILVVVSKRIKPSFLASTIIQQSLKSFFFLLLMLGLNFSESSLFNSYALLLQYTNCIKSSKSVVHFHVYLLKKLNSCSCNRVEFMRAWYIKGAMTSLIEKELLLSYRANHHRRATQHLNITVKSAEPVSDTAGAFVGL